MEINICDLHNHTTWSDGRHSPEEIIENAINNGIRTVGISDHFNKRDGHCLNTMLLNEYITAIRELKNRYMEKIEVLTGVEISMNVLLSDIRSLPYNQLNNLDFVLLEHVEFMGEEFIDDYCTKLRDLKKYTAGFNCILILAHTDIFKLAGFYGKIRDIEGGLNNTLRMLKDNKMHFELNVNPAYQYTDFILNNLENAKVVQLINKLREYDIKVTIGSDIHTLKSFNIEKIVSANEVALKVNK